MSSMTDPIDRGRLARTLLKADGLILSAGAGMGVDSGLPDFRGTEGFWQAYPSLGRSGIRFEEIANPGAFRDDPLLAWGFYGHRLLLYRNTLPHEGFGALLELSALYRHGSFVFTSNVDGQFQKAGFGEDRIVECHGSIHTLQCLENCRTLLWSAEDFHPDIDQNSGRLLSPFPAVPAAGLWPGPTSSCSAMTDGTTPGHAPRKHDSGIGNGRSPVRWSSKQEQEWPYPRSVFSERPRGPLSSASIPGNGKRTGQMTSPFLSGPGTGYGSFSRQSGRKRIQARAIDRRQRAISSSILRAG